MSLCYIKVNKRGSPRLERGKGGWHMQAYRCIRVIKTRHGQSAHSIPVLLLFALLFVCMGTLVAHASIGGASVGPPEDVIANPGQTVAVPINLTLDAGQLAGRASIYFRVVKNDDAPDIMGSLSFTANTPPGTPGTVEAISDPNFKGIHIAWNFDSPFSTQFTGPTTVTLGNVGIHVPPTAGGASYTIEVYGTSNDAWYSLNFPNGPWTSLGTLTLLSKTLTVNNAAPGTPTPISPIGGGIGMNPNFTFSAVSAAAEYRIYLWSAITRTGSFSPWYTAEEVGAPDGTGNGVIHWATALTPALYSWGVQARNPDGVSGWSSYLVFTVVASGTPPTTPVPVSPTGGAGVGPTPTFTFGAVSNALKYRVYVWSQATGTGAFSPWYTREEAGVPQGTGNGSITWATPLAAGFYTWYIQAGNDAGTSSWSAYSSFNVFVGTPPVAPTPLSPSGGGISTTPTFTFSAVSDATHYRVCIWSKSSGTTVTSPWYTAAEVGAPDGTGNGTIAWSSTLSSGLYTWYVQAKNAGGPGPWSGYLMFTVE